MRNLFNLYKEMSIRANLFASGKPSLGEMFDRNQTSIQVTKLKQQMLANVAQQCTNATDTRPASRQPHLSCLREYQNFDLVKNIIHIAHLFLYNHVNSLSKWRKKPEFIQTTILAKNHRVAC